MTTKTSECKNFTHSRQYDISNKVFIVLPMHTNMLFIRAHNHCNGLPNVD